MTRKSWFTAIGVVLLLAAVVIAAEYGYANSNGSRLRDKKRRFGTRTVVELRLNDRVELLEGEVGDPTWVKARTDDGKVGYIYGNALREEPLEGVSASHRPNDRRYAQNVGAAAKGWNKEIEDRAKQNDAEFRKAIENLEAMISFLDTVLRKPTSGPSYVESLDSFYEAGAFAPQEFLDSPPEDD